MSTTSIITIDQTAGVIELDFDGSAAISINQPGTASIEIADVALRGPPGEGATPPVLDGGNF